MKPPLEDSEKFVISELEVIRQTPPRNLEAAALTKLRFLAEARSMASEQPVKRKPLITGQFPKLRLSFHPLYASIAILLILVVSLFSMAQNAQASFPGDYLYSFKLFTEEARLKITPKIESRIDLDMAFSNRRLEEIKRLAIDGRTIPHKVFMTMQMYIDRALIEAANLEPAELKISLVFIQSILKQQQTEMANLESQYPWLIETKIRKNIQARSALVEFGIQEPLTFQQRLRQGDFTLPDVEPGKPADSIAPSPSNEQSSGAQPDAPNQERKNSPGHVSQGSSSSGASQGSSQSIAPDVPLHGFGYQTGGENSADQVTNKGETGSDRTPGGSTGNKNQDRDSSGGGSKNDSQNNGSGPGKPK